MESTGNEDLHASRRRIRELERRIARLERENRRLRGGASTPEQDVPPDGASDDPNFRESSPASDEDSDSEHEDNRWQQEDVGPCPYTSGLSRAQAERYARQLLLPEGFGPAGQRRLAAASVLVVGAGGIGSTALLYLAGFGVGTVGVVDFDVVEASNLHRQVIHRQRDVGRSKAESARRAVRELNPTVECRANPERLDHGNALQLVHDYDVVVDATDNPRTRYLVNDACVLAGKPLVSGSAVQSEGQLTIYHHNDGPCYRCLYPKPRLSVGCGRSCADAGVLGPAPGLVGILQAMEAVKILTGIGDTMERRMLHVNILQPSFVTFRKPPRQPGCLVCGPQATIRSMEDSDRNLAAEAPSTVCQTAVSLTKDHAISCGDYKRQIRDTATPHVLLDVRVEEQFRLCSLPGSINIPLNEIRQRLDHIQMLSGGSKPVYCICRRGVASVEATRQLLDATLQGGYPAIRSVCNISGGLQAWHDTVDKNFPNY